MAPIGDASVAAGVPRRRGRRGRRTAAAGAAPLAGPVLLAALAARLSLTLAAFSRALASFLRARRLSVAVDPAELAGGSRPEPRRAGAGGASAGDGGWGEPPAAAGAATAAAAAAALGASVAGPAGAAVGGGTVGGGTVRLLIACGGLLISSVSSVGETGVAEGVTSARSGVAGGRAIPPVGSSGARIFAVSSKMLGARIGIGAGRGSLSAARTSARPNCEAVKRSAASGRPARSSTAANGPRSADTGISLPIRADRVATVDSPSNGTLPVTASTRISANE